MLQPIGLHVAQYFDLKLPNEMASSHPLFEETSQGFLFADRID